ncbi:zinc finger protein 385D [Bombina bombina]|uniref:zinc finger protein 385D n=1 Tax=Bombina bombina TaxID=8345 RepID=UPI00235A8663|nr:zinc finger protein 385D [Bombina bombina]
MRNIMYFGGTCPNSALSALIRPPLPTLQHPLDIKQFLPFSLDNATAVNFFPNFNATGRLLRLRALDGGDTTSTLCTAEKNSEPRSEFLCLPEGGMQQWRELQERILFFQRKPHPSQAVAHYKGTKHAKKLKALEAMKNKQKSVATNDNGKTLFTSIPTNTINASCEKTEITTGIPAISTSTTLEIRKISVMTTETTSKVDKKITLVTSSSSICPSGETEEEKAKRLLYCSLCKVAVNSSSQLEAHNSGTKHKTMVEARNGSGTIKAFPRAGIKGRLPMSKGNTGLQNKTFHCEICDVHVNSETQLKQHISSRRHKDRAAGKPPKPKYSPYNKTQRGSTPLGVKLAFSKQRLKPLSQRILPNPLVAAAAAAAVAVNSPFSLRTTPAAALFQTSALPPALLRPAPGPIRTTHTPILFAPY